LGERGTRALVALACGAVLAVFVLNSIAPGGLCSEPFYETGDEWVYDFDMQILTFELSGTVTYSFEGESSKSVNGIVYNTYEIGYVGSLGIEGTVQQYTASGIATIVGTDSLDQASLDYVVSDSNLTLTVKVATYPPVAEFFWEHNVTAYSPPGGTGKEPENPYEGASWMKTSTEFYESMVNYNGDITEASSSISGTIIYTYLGLRTITVPAGTFECEVIQQVAGDSIQTDWYCDDVGMVVKSVSESGSSASSTQVLTSFSYTPPDTTPPTVSITGPLADAHFRGGYVDVAWECADNVAVVSTEMRIDGGSWEPVSGYEVQHLSLPSGYHVIEIRVTDSAGNQAVNSTSFDNDNRALSFGGPYYGLPLVAVIVSVVLSGLFIALTALRKRRVSATPPSQPSATPLSTQQDEPMKKP